MLPLRRKDDDQGQGQRSDGGAVRACEGQSARRQLEYGEPKTSASQMQPSQRDKAGVSGKVEDRPEQARGRVGNTQVSLAARPIYVIGIDPGVNTGLAVYNIPRGGLDEVTTTDFWEAYEYVTRVYEQVNTLLVIEDASLNAPTFRKKGNGSVQDRLCRNVGGVQRESQLLIAGFERAGYIVIRERPTQAKWDDAAFRAITGWDVKESAHGRDAARLCYGMRQWPLGVTAI
jgi:hypothetical protein